MTTTLRIANAPCSWGALEFEGMQSGRIPYGQMLNELRETGYTGTELGDWDYMPTDPAALQREMDARGLSMLGAFVPVALRFEERHADGAAAAVRVAKLLAGVTNADGTRPVLVLADENGSDPARTQFAGRITPAMGLSAEEWLTFARGAELVARAVRDEAGLATVFHHHCAGFVETPDEIARLMDLTDPALLGLVFDTGHYLYGSGGSDPAVVLRGLERFGDRIWHVHFKDCSPQIAAQARELGWGYFDAIRQGLFCELGRGNVDFAAVADWLRARAYGGWVVVEQDILPGMGAPRESARRNREYLASLGL
jgi:inosose dehydratase